MKQFLVVERAESGCKYSIGCGVRANILEAESKEAACELLKQVAFMSEEECYGYEGGPPAPKEVQRLWDKFHAILCDGEFTRTSVVIHEISHSFELPLSTWNGELSAWEKAVADAAQETEERQLLRKLQDKYKA